MNLLLLDESDYIAPGLVRIAGRRHRQLLEVIKAEPVSYTHLTLPTTPYV